MVELIELEIKKLKVFASALAVGVVAAIGTSIYVLSSLAYDSNKRAQEMNELRLQRPEVIYHNENVIGEETKDKYFVIDGKKAFVEIDGKTIEDYLGEKDD